VTAQIKYGMSDFRVVAACRNEMDAARAISGGGAYLNLDGYAEQTIMSLIIRQADQIRDFRLSVFRALPFIKHLGDCGFGSEYSRCSCGALEVYNEMKGLHDAGLVPPS